MARHGTTPIEVQSPDVIDLAEFEDRARSLLTEGNTSLSLISKMGIVARVATELSKEEQ